MPPSTLSNAHAPALFYKSFLDRDLSIRLVLLHQPNFLSYKLSLECRFSSIPTEDDFIFTANCQAQQSVLGLSQEREVLLRGTYTPKGHFLEWSWIEENQPLSDINWFHKESIIMTLFPPLPVNPPEQGRQLIEQDHQMSPCFRILGPQFTKELESGLSSRLTPKQLTEVASTVGCSVSEAHRFEYGGLAEATPTANHLISINIERDITFSLNELGYALRKIGMEGPTLKHEDRIVLLEVEYVGYYSMREEEGHPDKVVYRISADGGGDDTTIDLIVWAEIGK